MPFFKVLASSAGRRTKRLLGKSERYRKHHKTLNKAKISEEAVKKLKEAGWGNDPHWFAGGTLPRRHNRVTPLIDGENYFRELQEALSRAESYVFIVGWFLTPYIPISRNNQQDLYETRLLKLLEKAAENLPVRILLWKGAPFLFQPTTSNAKNVKNIFKNQGKGDMEFWLDPTASITHCHHQKAIVIDGQVAFVGGIDLTTFLGDRFDTQGHFLRAGINWHDCALKIEGPAVADVEHNFRQRWKGTRKSAGKTLPPSKEPYFEEAWQSCVQILRTIPLGFYKSVSRGEFGILHAYQSLISNAKHFIYLENQYLWSPYIFDALVEAIQKERPDPFRIIIVLPADAEDGKWDNDLYVKKLRDLDAGRRIVSIYSLYTSGPNIGIHPFTFRSIYVHAKVVIVDDEWLMVGSANMNNRGLITDSEINALVKDPGLAHKFRLDLWAEHMNVSAEEVAQSTLIEVIDRVWPEKANANAAIFKEKLQPFPSSLYHYQTGHMPGTWVLEETEALTLEH